MNTPVAPAVVRGEVVQADLVPFGGRDGDSVFRAPDPRALVHRLPLLDRGALSDLAALSTDDILDLLEALGEALELKRNGYLQEALTWSYEFAPVTPSLMHAQYASLGRLFNRALLEDIVSDVGREALDGWSCRTLADGRARRIRAFGARAVHVVAGNSPFVSAASLVRSALTRGDAVFKAPSNDPFTATAIARTLIDLAPDHPLTRHVSVAYWKGGDATAEDTLYQPAHFDKIVAWGGLASVRHVVRYVRPGLELVTLDPKRSVSIIGTAAFLDETVLDEVALRLATDVGALNQEACANARVVFVQCGTNATGLRKLEELAHRVYARLRALPAHVSTPARGGLGLELRAHLQAALLNDTWFSVIGGDEEEGAVVVSKLPEPVDFAPHLRDRVTNLVPVDDMAAVWPHVDAWCQTVGVYPDALAITLRDDLAFRGAQRIVSLGYALSSGFAGPQDGIEPVRRLCRWVVHEQCEPTVVEPVWVRGVGA